MKILVTEMPETPHDCLFSKPARIRGEVMYVCTLHPHVDDEETQRDHHKPTCLCKRCENCECLEVLR